MPNWVFFLTSPTKQTCSFSFIVNERHRQEIEKLQICLNAMKADKLDKIITLLEQMNAK
jgi:hypothetical protein